MLFTVFSTNMCCYNMATCKYKAVNYVVKERESGKERKGKERKAQDRKGKERKAQKRKGKEICLFSSFRKRKDKKRKGMQRNSEERKRKERKQQRRKGQERTRDGGSKVTFHLINLQEQLNTHTLCLGLLSA